MLIIMLMGIVFTVFTCTENDITNINYSTQFNSWHSDVTIKLRFVCKNVRVHFLYECQNASMLKLMIIICLKRGNIANA